jgi:hypothetical protein
VFLDHVESMFFLPHVTHLPACINLNTYLSGSCTPGTDTPRLPVATPRASSTRLLHEKFSVTGTRMVNTTSNI